MADPHIAKILAAREQQSQAGRDFMTALREGVAAGVPQTQICEALEIPRVTLWRWLNGHVMARTRN